MNDFEVRRAEDNGTIKRCLEIRNKVFTVEKMEFI